MQVRFSSCIGLPVVEEGMDEAVGTISGILLHPDTGSVEGFTVRIPRFLRSEELFCASVDILRWGARVTVRDVHAVGRPEDFYRLQPLFEDDRTVLHQPIHTKSGLRLGTCRDIQFETRSMKLSWLFPRRGWRWGSPIAASDILEVMREAVVVRDPTVAAPVEAEAPAMPFPEVREPGMSRKS